jgi:hypothetical protein
MDRIQGLSQQSIDTLRAGLQAEYPDNQKPCPSTPLKIDDDIMYLDVFPMRTLWGTDGPDYAFFYAPDIFGEIPGNLDAHYITDRAPADPQETPMPIWPQQAQQPQHRKHDKKAALRELLKQVPPENKKKVRALIKAKKPDLLDDEDDDK